MKLKELLNSVACLVAEREIIDHGSIRCLYSDRVARQIMMEEGCNEVDTGTIGDDDLASRIAGLAEGDEILDVHTQDLESLTSAYRGKDVSDYIDRNREDKLVRLEKLIDAAREITL